jgi:hypothetical protein
MIRAGKKHMHPRTINREGLTAYDGCEVVALKHQPPGSTQFFSSSPLHVSDLRRFACPKVLIDHIQAKTISNSYHDTHQERGLFVRSTRKPVYRYQTTSMKMVQRWVLQVCVEQAVDYDPVGVFCETPSTVRASYGRELGEIGEANSQGHHSVQQERLARRKTGHGAQISIDLWKLFSDLISTYDGNGRMNVLEECVDA